MKTLRIVVALAGLLLLAAGCAKDHIPCPTCLPKDKGVDSLVTSFDLEERLHCQHRSATAGSVNITSPADVRIGALLQFPANDTQAGVAVGLSGNGHTWWAERDGNECPVFSLNVSDTGYHQYNLGWIRNLQPGNYTLVLKYGVEFECFYAPDCCVTSGGHDVGIQGIVVTSYTQQ